MWGSITVTERKVFSVAEFNAAAAEFPQGLAIDQRGNIYVGVPTTVEVKKVTPGGEVSTFAQLPSVGGDEFLTGLALGPFGNLYVAISSFSPDTHGVWRVSQDGIEVKRFAALDTGGLPNGLAFDRGGNLYVSDSTGGQV